MQHAADVAPLSSEFWKQPFRVPASSDPDTATAQTIGIMCGHIKGGAGDSLVHQTADDAVQRFAGVSVAGDAIERTAGAVWWWCKTFIKFVHHEAILRRVLGEAGHLQGLIAPEILVRMDKPEGDCAIFTECLCSFLRVFGIPYEIVTVAVNPNEPDVFSHVYAYAVLSDGSRLPLDASHGEYPGWQVPSSHVSRRQVWDADGNTVADRGSRFDGLHNYGLRGLGDFCDDYPEECGQAGASTSSSYGILNVPYVDAVSGAPAAYSPSTLPAGAISVPSQNSAQWSSFATQLAKMGFTLQQQAQLKPGQVILPNGTILQQAAGLPVPVGNLGTSINTALGGGNMLLYLGLGAALLIGVSMMGGSGRR